jgi:pantothenate kinase
MIGLLEDVETSISCRSPACSLHGGGASCTPRLHLPRSPHAQVPYVIGTRGVAVGKSTFARLLQTLLKAIQPSQVDLVTTDGFCIQTRCSRPAA